MKNIIVFGAGLVSRPLVRYLLEKGYNVTIATRTVSKGLELLEKCNNKNKGNVVEINVEKPDEIKKIKEMIKENDIVVSLLPYVYHPIIGEICTDLCKDMVTTSYVSEKMQALNQKAVDSSIIILNEIGLDPGIDHMSAMKIIDKVHKDNGKIKSFYSYCGGLPAPEYNNPCGYKFSWSPVGVLRAGKNDAKYLKNGNEIIVKKEKLFESYHIVNIPGIGTMEVYPNRDSISYIKKYGIEETETMYRGTLRYPGWCETMKKIIEIGMLDETTKNRFDDITIRDLVAKLIDAKNKKNVKEELIKKLKIDEKSDIMRRFEYIGLFGEDKISLGESTILEAFAWLLSKKLKYEKGEKDMIVLHHQFIAEYDEKKEEIISTLILFGNEDTAMAKTVSLPAAIAVKLIAEKKIHLTGVHIPTRYEIYEQVMNELEKYDIKFDEKNFTVS